MTRSCLVAARRPELLRSLKRALEPEVEVVGMSDNLLSLEDSLSALDPEIAVVDLDLLGDAPWKLLSLLKRGAPRVRLVLLVSELGPDAHQLALRAGADHIVERSGALTSLRDAVLDSLQP